MTARRWDHLIYSSAVILPRLPAFLLLPLIANTLSLTDMGKLTTSWVFIEIFQTLAGMGLKASLGRFFPIAKSHNQRREILSTTLYGILSGTVVLGIVTWILFTFPMIKNHIQFFASIDFHVLITLLLAALMGNLSSTFIIYFRAEQKAVTFLITSFIGSFVEVAFILLLFKNQKITLLSLLIVEFLKQSVMFLFIAYQGRKDLSLKISTDSWRTMFRFGIWMVPVGISEWLVMSSDRFWLGQQANLSQVGVYGFLYKFAMPLGIFFTGSLMDYHARLYRMEVQDGLIFTHSKLNQFLGRYGLLMLGFAVCVPIGFHWLIQIYPFFPPIYLSGLPAFPIMIAVIYTFYWGKFYSMILEYQFRPKAIMNSVILGTLTTFLFIPAAIHLCQKMGWDLLVGTAYGALTAQLMTVGILAKIAGLTGAKKSIPKGIGLVLGCVLISTFLMIYF